VRTIRQKCLDWLLIFSKRQLERPLHTYIDHYNRQRSHRALGLIAPDPPSDLIPLQHATGLLHEYARAA